MFHEPISVIMVAHNVQVFSISVVQNTRAIVRESSRPLCASNRIDVVLLLSH